jgi:SpoVK/Ycf46/Vps4 family AAA+-type ATPase
VECLHKDSIISWKTEHEKEKFFVQGVFLIKTKDVEFLHAALFHKGNQNEDEISFFVICDKSNFEEYVKLRNAFDEWVLERDRSNLHIRVIEGDDLPYTKDHTWEELFLPEDIKTEIKGLVENFLASKDFYLENRIPWKRGILLYGKPGNGKTSIIRTIMSAYNFKPVTIVSGANDESVREAFSYAEEQSPALLYFEDLDSLLEKNVDISSFLNLMDGISAKNGLLVLATANNVKKLQSNITDRPSRFDRKFEIPLPNAEMAYIYLKRWFGNLITVKKCRELAKYAAKYEFSYAYLKELYISSMFEALGHNRKSPTEKDVQSALNHLIKDKNLLNSGAVNMDKYIR